MYSNKTITNLTRVLIHAFMDIVMSMPSTIITIILLQQQYLGPTTESTKK